VVIDIRAQVRRNVDYQLTVGDLKAWQARYGPMPKDAMCGDLLRLRHR
jgi:hypothetical protein